MQKTSKIIVFSTAYLPHIGGAELALQAIMRRLPDIAFDVVTAKLSADDLLYECDGNISIHRVGGFVNRLSFFVPKLFFPIFALWKALLLTWHKGRYDVIFALQASQGAGAATMYHWFYKTPMVLNIQEGKSLADQPWLISFLRAFIIKRARLITVISKYLRGHVLSLRISPEKVIIIPNGIDEVVFNSYIDQSVRTYIRHTLNISDKSKLIVSASRLVYKNGMDILIKTMPLLSDKYRLVLIGDGDERGKLESIVRDAGLGQRVCFLGTLDHSKLADYLRASDVFVRPSHSEGLGTAFLEAMACGVPIIAPRVGGIGDFLRDAETGIVIEPDSPESIAQAVARLEDDELRLKIIRQAQELIQQKYLWDHIAQQYRVIFQGFGQ